MTPTLLRIEVEPGRSLAVDGYGDPTHPPVVFLHGGGQTRHAWGGTASAVAARGWYCLNVDQRGHGDADRHPEGRYELSGFVLDLAALVSQLDRPPVLVGASLGGIASLMAETAPDAGRIAQAMVLVDVTPRMAIAGVQRILQFMAAFPDGFDSLEAAAEHVAGYQPHRKKRRDLSGLRKNLRQGSDGRWRWHWDPRLLNSWNPERFASGERVRIVAERLERAAKLTVPTLLVRGRMSDVVTKETAQEFLGLVPHAEYVDLAGAHHMVAGDRNDAFTEVVIDFLGRLREQPVVPR